MTVASGAAAVILSRSAGPKHMLPLASMSTVPPRCLRLHLQVLPLQLLLLLLLRVLLLLLLPLLVLLG